MISIIKYAHDFTHLLTSQRYKQAPKKKICRDKFHGDLFSAYTTGAMAVVDIIRKGKSNKEFVTLDELEGALEVIDREANNHFRENYDKSGRVQKKEITGVL